MDQNIADVHGLVEYLVGQPVLTHELAELIDVCGQGILEQHPGLAMVQIREHEPATNEELVQAYAREYGWCVSLEPLDRRRYGARIDNAIRQAWKSL